MRTIIRFNQGISNFLDPTYKTIILLRYYHDLSIKEIVRFLILQKER